MAMQVSIDEMRIGKERIDRERHQEALLSASAATRGVLAVGFFKKIASFASAARKRAVSLLMEKIRSGNGRACRQRQMKLIESLALGNRRQLLLIVCDNRRYLVGVGADNVGSILAIEQGTVSHDRSAQSLQLESLQLQSQEPARPELVRPGGGAKARKAQPHTSGSGFDLWH